ncbi:TPA: helix-turn-helix transcriptional regulator [Pseudomonas aeruginosa]|jgi:transcriptional regulator with XRE-family HTH domain|uniref:helix-turn-helix domain-containing protein n=1 Tax=Pseudomonas TaxID=286 RepID=UPI0003BAFEAF|nr:helix-turn-helix transcriptional regulator [Pseudomonas aeruginosa]EKP5709116.1 helix-turn-helix domain-containing protein [Pseudomonas aeruginosa]EKW6179152.1 helix-turn-helix domain-containing protein [Pseudomonas aeruginosa]EKW6337795.1 helix-turn-helix domain-containing protein [Pseudomonas aeruginosa]EKX5765222.1 helix-turn-helix domain-containing protein [Pseudomonas aeruginosa]EKX9246838.1 helix-turn-helix domain-containing protein [Pseudomonas aeruginosa]
MDFATKLKAMRAQERVTQAEFAALTGISISTVKKYEGASFEMGYGALTKVLGHERFKKYTLWLMIGETAPECGQVAPE